MPAIIGDRPFVQQSTSLDKRRNRAYNYARDYNNSPYFRAESHIGFSLSCDCAHHEFRNFKLTVHKSAIITSMCSNPSNHCCAAPRYVVYMTCVCVCARGEGRASSDSISKSVYNAICSIIDTW